MADPKKRLPLNVPGDWFVDSTCIDCDTCRQLAPEVFGESPDYSFVRRQPASDAERRRAAHALLACPTGSIGTQGVNPAKAAIDDFPLPIEDGVYYCGFNSPKSFGGNSYFVRHADGNWLVDSPKFLPQLVERFDQWGGIARIFLTHRDDVADAARYAERFGAQRIIHRRELNSQPDAEIVLDGDDAIELAPGFRAIPTSGHTAGHCVLLFDTRFLFTGDHLWWDRDAERLDASEDYCWDSWDRQRESMARLIDEPFEWVLPGHGQRVRLPRDRMQSQLRELVERMSVTA